MPDSNPLAIEPVNDPSPFPIPVSPAEPSEPPAARPPRKPGGQPGNKNAIRHGFYARTWKVRECKGLDATSAKDLTEEIALLRVYIRRMVEMHAPSADGDKEDRFIRTLAFAAVSLNRLVRTQFNFSPQGESELILAIRQAVREVNQENDEKIASSNGAAG